MQNITVRPKTFIATSLLALVVALTLIWGQVAHANPSYYMVPQNSASATTTLVFFPSSGALSYATSTTIDSYTSVNQGFNKNALGIQFVASSTSSILTYRYQYSTDNIDWYDDNYQVSATSSVTGIGSPLGFTWAAITAGTSSKLLMVPTPTRYVRAIFQMTGAAGGIWYSWIPARDLP